MSYAKTHILATIGAVALVVFLVIMIMRFWFPDTCEQRVLMKMPAYRYIKNKLDSNTAELNKLKSAKKDADSKLANMSTFQSKTPEEKMLALEDLNKTRADVATKQNSILQNAKKIADLTSELTELKSINADMSTTIKSVASTHLTEVTDFVIKSFSFKNKDLIDKIKSLRKSMVSAIQGAQGLSCQIGKADALAWVALLVQEMRNNVGEVNQLCDEEFLKKNGLRTREFLLYNQGWECEIKEGDMNVCRPFGGKTPVFGPLQDNFTDLFFKLEVLIIHIILNNLCNGITFDIDKFETYATKAISGLCESKDWKAPLGQWLDYVISKPISYAY